MPCSAAGGSAAFPPCVELDRRRAFRGTYTVQALCLRREQHTMKLCSCPSRPAAHGLLPRRSQQHRAVISTSWPLRRALPRFVLWSNSSPSVVARATQTHAQPVPGMQWLILASRSTAVVLHRRRDRVRGSARRRAARPQPQQSHRGSSSNSGCRRSRDEHGDGADQKMASRLPMVPRGALEPAELLLRGTEPVG